jgi:hypothetical protein
LTVGAVSHITVDRFVLLGSANGDGKQDSASAAASSISADSPASSQFTDEEMPL